VARAKVIAVLVGPEGVGVVGIVDQIVLVVMNLSALSLPLSALAFLSRSYGQGPAAFKRTYLTFLAVLSALTLAGTAGAVGLVAARSSLLGESLLRYQPLLILGLLSVPALAATTFGASVLAAAQRARQAAVVAAISATALFLAAVVGVLGGGLEGLYWVSLVVGVLVAGATFGHLHRQLRLPFFERRVRLAAELTHHPDVVFYCVSYFLVSLAYPLAWLIARYSVLDHVGEAEAGRLQAVIALMVGFGTVLRPVNSQLLLPIVSGPGDTGRKFRDTVGVQRRLTVTLALLAMPLVLFPRWLLAMLYSSAFTAASPYVHLFVVAEVILILGTTYQVLVLGMDDMRVWALIFFIGYVCLGGMAWGLGGNHGILGVGLAAIAGSILIFGLALWRLRSRHGFRLPRGLLGLMIVVLAAIFAAGIVCARYDDGSVAALLVKVVVLLIFAPSLIRCLDKEDRAWVYGFLTRFQPRSS
jgi:O-antigen/teichoic acid export membrane protein